MKVELEKHTCVKGCPQWRSHCCLLPVHTDRLGRRRAVLSFCSFGERESPSFYWGKQRCLGDVLWATMRRWSDGHVSGGAQQEFYLAKNPTSLLSVRFLDRGLVTGLFLVLVRFCVYLQWERRNQQNLPQNCWTHRCHLRLTAVFLSVQVSIFILFCLF